MKYRYEKLDENYNRQYCPINDYDGSITGTGNCIIGLAAWFDENPEKRIELGWIKHWYYEKASEIKETVPEYNPALHYLTMSTEMTGDHEMKDVYHIIEKTEEMLVLEEMLETMNLYVPAGTMIVDSQGGAIL